MWWKIKNFFKKLYFVNFKKVKIKTVELRGKLNNEDKYIFENSKHKINLKNLLEFYFENQIYLEIGFGNGHHLIELAKENKDKIIIGVELYKAGIVKVLKEIAKNNLNNLFVICNDGRIVLEFLEKFKIKNSESQKHENFFQKIFVLFPDPWPKKHQQKRRIVNENFINLCLNNGKELIIATDWQNYADNIESLLENLKTKRKIIFEKLIESRELKNNQKFKNIFNSTFARRAEKEGRTTIFFKIFNK